MSRSEFPEKERSEFLEFALRYRFAGLSLDETAPYVRAYLGVAGAKPDA